MTLLRRLFGTGGPSGRGLVLLYHRIATPDRDPQALSVSPANFAAHLAVIREIAAPMELGEMTRRALAGRSLPERAVAISFDDGYADNILAAEPLLAQASMNATVFVATGFVRANRPYWWDRVEEAVLGGLAAGRHVVQFPGEALELDIEGDPLGRDAWTALKGLPPSSRHRAYDSVMQRVKPLAPEQAEAVLAALGAMAGLAPAASAAARPATPDEIAASARRRVLRFEPHTLDHPQLSHLPAARQREQIAGSALELRAWTGRKPSLFAYPYGTQVDFDRTTEQAVAAAGLTAAFANWPGPVSAGVSRWAIPRILVRDIEADEFRNQIGWFFRHYEAGFA